MEKKKKKTKKTRVPSQYIVHSIFLKLTFNQHMNKNVNIFPGVDKHYEEIYISNFTYSLKISLMSY